MGLQDVDLVQAFRNLAERRIEQAMEEGKFDNLEGAGKPLDLEPLPADEQARATYWAMRIMKNADVVPDEVRLRREIAVARRQAEAATGPQKRVLTARHNVLVKKLNTLGTNQIKTPLNPMEAS